MNDPIPSVSTRADGEVGSGSFRAFGLMRSSVQSFGRRAARLARSWVLVAAWGCSGIGGQTLAQVGAVDTSAGVFPDLRSDYVLSGNASAATGLPDGRVIIAGRFDHWNGHPTTGLVRLQTDGTVDRSFAVVTGAAMNARQIIRLPDGGLLALSPSSGEGHGMMAVRLDATGTLDPGFRMTNLWPGGFSRMALDNRQRIYVDLSGYNHTNASYPKYVGRWLPDGRLDTTFKTDLGLYFTQTGIGIRDLLPLADGSLLLLGNFRNGQATNRVTVRLDEAGQLTTAAELPGRLGNTQLLADGDQGFVMLNSWSEPADSTNRLMTVSWLDQELRLRAGRAVITNQFPYISARLAGREPDGAIWIQFFKQSTYSGGSGLGTHTLRRLTPEGAFDDTASPVEVQGSDLGAVTLACGHRHNWFVWVSPYGSLRANSISVPNCAPLLREPKPTASVFEFVRKSGAEGNPPHYRVNESEGHFRINVRRLNGTLGEAKIGSEVVPDAVYGQLEPSRGTLVFTNGQILQELAIPIQNQTTGFNLFSLRLLAEPGGLPGPAAEVEVSVSDDEQGGQLDFDQATLSLGSLKLREQETNLVFTVARQYGTNGVVSVRYRFSGTAIQRQDFLATEGVLQFAEGQLTNSFEVRLLNDEKFDPDKYLQVDLLAPDGGAWVGPASRRGLRVGIPDDETGLSLSATPGVGGWLRKTVETTEGEQAVTMVWSRTGDDSRALTGRLELVSGDATALADPGRFPLEVRLDEGVASRSVAVALKDDLLVSPPRKLVFRLTTLGFEPPLGHASEVTVQVYDDDSAGAARPLLQAGSSAYDTRLTAVDAAGNFYVTTTTYTYPDQLRNYVGRALPSGEADLRWKNDPANRHWRDSWWSGILLTSAGEILGQRSDQSFSWQPSTFDGWPRVDAGQSEIWGKPGSIVPGSKGEFLAWESGNQYWYGVISRYSDQLKRDAAFRHKVIPGILTAVWAQPDGRYLVGGLFTNFGVEPAASLLRLHHDGSRDGSFDPGAGPDGEITTLAVQPDGKILVAGAFTQFAGQPRRGLARLLANGSVDPGFAPLGLELPKPITVVADQEPQIRQDRISTILPLRAGGIFLGGHFSLFNGQPCGNYVVLRDDGQADPEFVAVPGASAAVSAAFELADGDVAITGGFNWVNTRRIEKIARLRVATLPVIEFAGTNFTATMSAGQAEVRLIRRGDASGDVSARLVSRDGDAAAGTDYPATSTVVRFEPGQTNLVLQVPLLPTSVYSGRRRFYLELSEASAPATLGWKSAQVSVYGLGEASLDPSLNWPAAGSHEIRQLSPTADGRWLAVGRAPGVPWEVFRLHPNGSLDTSWLPPRPERGFSTNETIVAAMLADGSVLVGGSRLPDTYFPVLRLRPDGAVDDNFRNRVFTGWDSPVTALVPLPDGKFFAAGNRLMSRRRADGGADSTYNGYLPAGAVGVSALARMPDGGLIGSWQYYSDQTADQPSIFRLKADGSWDGTFIPYLFGDGRCFAPHPDGGVLVGGWFENRPTGWGKVGLVRLLANGVWLRSSDVVTDGYVLAITPSASGKYWIGGDFTMVNGVRRPGLARLNADLSVDTGWDLGEGVDGTVRTVVENEDGAVLAGGSFDFVDGQRRTGLLRLRGRVSPGQLQFSTHTYSARESEGSAVVRVQRKGGAFGHFRARLTTQGGSAVPGVDYQPVDEVMEFEDGDGRERTVNIPLLLTPANSGMVTIGLRLTALTPGLELSEKSRAQILVYDEMPPLNPSPASSAVGWPGQNLVSLADGSFVTQGTNSGQLVRILPNGQQDPEFSCAFPPHGVRALAALRDGRIIVGAEGGFVVRHAGGATTNLVRLLPDGSVDPSFRSPRITDGASLRVLPLANGQFLVSGLRIVRLNADGSHDPTFNCTILNPLCLAVQPDGRYLAGIGPVGFSLTAPAGVVRLRPDGSQENPMLISLTPRLNGHMVSDLAVQPDGKIIVAGTFSHINGVPKTAPARVWPDGRLDPEFASDVVFGGHLSHVRLGPDGMVYVAGGFHQINSRPQLLLARFFPNGSFDPMFRVEPKTDTYTVTALEWTPEGDLLLGGLFNGWNPTVNLLRVNVPRVQPPQVQVQLVDGRPEYRTGDAVKVWVRASSERSVITRLELWLDGVRKLAELDGDTGTFSVQLDGTGGHGLTVAAVDVTGARAASAPVRVLVRAAGAALITRALVGADQQIHLQITADIGARYRIESSGDLASWELHSTATTEADSFELTLPVPATSRRFFRLTQE